MRNGSLLNHLISNGTGDATPSVGDGATVIGWSDRRAGTVTAVSKSGKRITVTRDRAIRTDTNGMSDAQSYRFEPDADGQTWDFTLRQNGAWVVVGGSAKTGTRARLGARDEYYDYSF